MIKAPSTYLGRTVVLTQCRAQHEDHGDILISGTWVVDEYQPVEYAAGITSEYFTLASAEHNDADGDPIFATADPYALIEQIDPKAHMKSLDFERQMARAEEADIELQQHGMPHPVDGAPTPGIRIAHDTRHLLS